MELRSIRNETDYQEALREIELSCGAFKPLTIQVRCVS